MTASSRWSWTLVGWTLFVWGQRVVNVLGDDELETGQVVSGLLVAVLFVGLAVALAAALRRHSSRRKTLVELLAVAGMLRWTLRAPIVLASSEWSAGFKVVHTALWLGTVGLSLLAWREVRRRVPNSSSAPVGR